VRFLSSIKKPNPPLTTTRPISPRNHVVSFLSIASNLLLISQPSTLLSTIFKRDFCWDRFFQCRIQDLQSTQTDQEDTIQTNDSGSSGLDKTSPYLLTSFKCVQTAWFQSFGPALKGDFSSRKLKPEELVKPWCSAPGRVLLRHSSLKALSASSICRLSRLSTNPRDSSEATITGASQPLTHPHNPLSHISPRRPRYLSHHQIISS